MGNVVQENEKAIFGAIKIDEKEIRTHLDGLVRQSVEDTLRAFYTKSSCPAFGANRSNHSETNVYKIADTTERRARNNFCDVKHHTCILLLFGSAEGNSTLAACLRSRWGSRAVTQIHKF